ncbi:UNVERIFIED_CONTAM: hypothetical protein ITI05_24995, partial [Salmonella enterica subsp. enterica serovar Weltevreden]
CVQILDVFDRMASLSVGDRTCRYGDRAPICLLCNRHPHLPAITRHRIHSANDRQGCAIDRIHCTSAIERECSAIDRCIIYTCHHLR